MTTYCEIPGLQSRYQPNKTETSLKLAGPVSVNLARIHTQQSVVDQSSGIIVSRVKRLQASSQI